MCEEPLNLILAGYGLGVATALSAYVTSQVDAGSVDFLKLLIAEPSLPQESFSSAFGSENIGTVTIRKFNSVIYIGLSESWAEHRKVISRSMRDNLAYYPKLLKRNGHEWEVVIHSHPDEMEAAIQTLADLHYKRSVDEKMRLHKVHIEGELQQHFLVKTYRELVQSGEGFIAELVVQGKAIASQAFLRHGPDLTIYYSGFDPEWSKFSPLFVLNAAVIERQMAGGVRRLNFLTVPGQWQLRWGPKEEVETFNGVFLTRKPVNRLRALYFLSKRMMRTRLHEVYQHFKAGLHDRRRRLLRRASMEGPAVQEQTPPKAPEEC